MDFKGYNGTIAIEGDLLTVTHSGLVAKVGGLVRDQPRHIPLQAVSDVAFKDASRMTNGWITLGLGGADAVSLTSGTAASNPDTIIFRYRDANTFRDLHRWLVDIARKNRELRIDFARVTFDPAGETRSERSQAKLEHRAANLDEKSATRTPAAGWYADTTGSDRMRYWDGAAWTDHVSKGPLTDAASSTPGQARPAGKPWGRAVQPWSEQFSSQGIVGESFHEPAFRALASEYGHRSIPDYGVEIKEARAAIVRDPENPYDSNAVAVWINGRHLVGHLPRNVAAQYTDALEKLDAGTYLQVPARAWMGQRTDWDARTDSEGSGLVGSVRVYLPNENGIIPFNDVPEEPHTILPWGRVVQITGEEHHMDVLRTFVLGSVPRHVAATLHVVDEPRRGGDTVRLVEVRLDNQRVGVMSKPISDQLHDLVTYVAARGRVPVARAVIKGSDLRADVTVHVARTSEVPQKWLDTVVPS